MAIRYSRSALLSMRNWWKKQPRNIKPMLPTDWNACKAAGILKHSKGKRGGACNRLTNSIQVLGSRRRQTNIPVANSTRNQVTANHWNLLNIQIDTSIQDLNAANTSSSGRPHFVPSILLSNAMSLAPKIDEIAYTLNSTNTDIAFFSETWLKETVPDDPIKIKGYQLLRRDRKNRAHGGVCLYAKNSIQCKILPDLHSVNHEVLWVELRPNRLPRGFSNIIAAVIYHPPDADNTAKRDYLRSSLTTVKSKYPNSVTILAGDFNKLDFTSTAKSFQLKPIIDFPTRGANTLDQIFTNSAEYYSSPVSAPPFGLSDHLTVTVSPRIREKPSKPKLKVIKTRDKRPSKIASVGRFLLQVPWSDLFLPDQSCEDKLSILTEIVNYGLDTIMPERSVRVHETDRPWMNSQLKALIARRQKALATNNVPLFKILRNKVNRERKRCRKTRFRSYLVDRFQQVVIHGHSSRPVSLQFGVPQGSVLGPLLFALFFAPIEDIISAHGLKVMVYADDTQLYISISSLDDRPSALSLLETCTRDILIWCTINGLACNPDKTEIIHLSSRFSKTPPIHAFNVNGYRISPSHSVRSLGVTLDRHLQMSQHVNMLCKSAFFSLKNISKIRKFLDRDNTERLVHAFISSKIDYCNSILIGLPNEEIDKIQRVQNAAARLISGTKKYASITPILIKLHWLPVIARIEYKILLTVFKSLNNLATEYISELLNQYNPPRALRSANKNLLIVPKTLNKTYGDRAFYAAAPKLWNNLPQAIRDCNSITSFKLNLKTHLFRKHYKL